MARAQSVPGRTGTQMSECVARASRIGRMSMVWAPFSTALRRPLGLPWLMPEFSEL